MSREMAQELTCAFNQLSPEAKWVVAVCLVLGFIAFCLVVSWPIVKFAVRIVEAEQLHDDNVWKAEMWSEIMRESKDHVPNERQQPQATTFTPENAHSLSTSCPMGEYKVKLFAREMYRGDIPIRKGKNNGP